MSDRDTSRDVLDARARVDAVLGSVRRRRRLQALAATAGWIAGSLALGVAILVATASLGGRGRWLLAAPAAVSAAGTLAAVLLALRRPWRRTGEARRVARAVDAVLGADDVLLAVELDRLRERGVLPEEWVAGVDRHLVRVALRVAPLTAEGVVPWSRPDRVALGGLALAILVAAGTLAPGTAGRVTGALSAPVAVAATAAGVEEPDLVLRDVEVTLRPPAYTGEEARTLPGGSGEFAALPGTAVVVRASAGAPVAAVAFRLGEGPWQPGEVRGTDGVEMSFVVGTQRGWEVEVRGARRSEPLRTGRLRIIPRHDLPPRVALIDPPEAVLEVDDATELVLRLQARDDYGLTRVDRVVRRAGVEVRRDTVHEFDGAARSGEVTVRWRPDAAAELAGDVEVLLQVFDNDTVSGPKAGSSEPVHLRILSAADRRHRVLLARRRMMNAALAALGEHLLWADSLDRRDLAAAAAAPDGASRRMEELGMAASELRRVQERDPAPDGLGHAAIGVAMDDASRSWDLLRQRLRAAEIGPDDGVRDALEDHVDRLERLALVLDHLVSAGAWEEALVASREVAAAMEQVERALASGDQRAIDEALRRLDDAMAELQRRMAAIDPGQRGELMNTGTDAAPGGDLMERLARLVEQGRVDEAMRMLAEASRSMAELEERGMRAGGADAAAALDALEETARAVDDLARRQREINGRMGELAAQTPTGLPGTEALEGDIARLRERVDELGARETSDRMVGATAHRLERMGRDLEDAEKGLGRGDTDGAIRSVAASDAELLDALELAGLLDEAGATGMTREDFDGWRSEAEAAEGEHLRIIEEILALERSRRRARMEASVPGERLAEEQRALAGDAASLVRRLAASDQPLAGGKARQRPLRDAEQLMRGAARDLAQGDVGRARTGGEQAARQLDQLQQDLERLVQDLSRGGGTASIPLAARGWRYAPGSEGLDAARGMVEIPPPGRFDDPAELRRAAVEAATEDAPPSYRPLNDAYYEELVR